MKFVYLINQQDRWCPENNNGDYFIEAYSTEEAADARCAELNKKEDIWIYYVREFVLDATEEEAYRSFK